MTPVLILLLICICSSSLSSGWPSIVASLAAYGISSTGGDDKKPEEKKEKETDSSACKVTVYKDANYKGDYIEFDTTVTNTGADKMGFNDNISSVKAEGPCKEVKLWEHAGLMGAQYNVLDSPAAENMNLDNFNDRTSSIVIKAN